MQIPSTFLHFGCPDLLPFRSRRLLLKKTHPKVKVLATALLQALKTRRRLSKITENSVYFCPTPAPVAPSLSHSRGLMFFVPVRFLLLFRFR